MPIKKRMKRKIYQQRYAKIQSKTYISAEVFFLLTCDYQVFFLFSVFASVRGGLDPFAIQSNHLLGNRRDTHGTLACQFNRPLASFWPVKMAL